MRPHMARDSAGVSPSFRRVAAVAHRRTAVAALALLAVTTSPAGAEGSELQPLRVDASTPFGVVRDRVLPARTSSTMAARATGPEEPTTVFHTADGTAITISISPSYSPDQVAVQSYVDFLGGLPHGSELGKLRLHLAPPDEVVRLCDGEPVVACYDPAAQRMTVPGEPVRAEGGVTTEYVMAHEYGHHVAANRSHDPFSALAIGPKYWSSYVRACAGVNDKRYSASPSAGYRRSPGENWAETYARLRFPAAPWTFAPSLQPDSAALAAARRDVTDPWRRYRTRVVRGTVNSRRRTGSHRLVLRLDGALTVRLQGPRNAELDLRLSDGRTAKVRTRNRGSRDVLRLPVACRDEATEKLMLEVLGRGPVAQYRATITYAG